MESSKREGALTFGKDFIHTETPASRTRLYANESECL